MFSTGKLQLLKRKKKRKYFLIFLIFFKFSQPIAGAREHKRVGAGHVSVHAGGENKIFSITTTRFNTEMGVVFFG